MRILGLMGFLNEKDCLIIYDNNERYCAKELVLLPGANSALNTVILREMVLRKAGNFSTLASVDYSS